MSRQMDLSLSMGDNNANLNSEVPSSTAHCDVVHADEAFATLEVMERNNLHLDDATNRRLLRRVDCIIMPLLCLVYGVQFLDRTTLSYASVMGFQKDIGLVGQDYSWIGSVFFFGFLGVEFVTGRLLQKFPLGKYLGISAILWGTLSCAFAAVHNYADAIALRFLLGMTQACVSPALILHVSQWYTKAEQSTRTAVWVSSSGFAQIFGGLVSYAIARGDDTHDLTVARWKIVYLVFGCLTILIGILCTVLVPDNQLNAWWLSRDDRILAVQRVRANQQGIGNRHFKLRQFREALLDPFSWAVFFFAIAANIPNGGLTNFFSQLIVSFGFTPQQSLLYGTPAGALGVFIILAWGLLSQRYGSRILWGLLAVVTAIIGVLLIVTLPLRTSVGRLIGYYMTMALPAAEASILSLIASNVAGYTKKTTVSALFFLGYCIGNIIGPQTFRAHDEPRYVSAEITIIVLLAACVGDMILIYFYLRWQNKSKEEERRRTNYEKRSGIEFWDLTDKENPEFVYSL